MTARRDLRVLMTADPIGGVWTYARELIGALADRRVEVVLATMGAPLTTAQLRAVQWLPNAHLAESRLALEWMPAPWRDVDTLREVWGEAAIYVPPGDPPALAFALEALIRDPLRRGALAARARARALALTPQRMATAYRAVYDELAAAPRQDVFA